MNPRHRKQAIIGATLWYAVLLAFIALAIWKRGQDGDDSGKPHASLAPFIWTGIIFQSACFFWGGYQLARAKGYSKDLAYLGLLGPCVQLLVLTLLLVLPDKQANLVMRSYRAGGGRVHESATGRTIRYRRNALVWNSAGLFAILIGVASVIFPTGMFADPANETVLGILVFAVGYIAVMTGCWWWVKAKCWPETVVAVGLWPFIPFFIPFVRVLVLRVLFSGNIGVFSAVLLMVPFTLLVLVFVLPDKSGIQKRKHWERD
ncbi:MAG: hypothetical protein EPO07_16655 [Verrucomicrobia bacterium]|nr:MAG: hypothetical protein EPO07_16655 [Verrucomicrobiota bacterium]